MQWNNLPRTAKSLLALKSLLQFPSSFTNLSVLSLCGSNGSLVHFFIFYFFGVCTSTYIFTSRIAIIPLHPLKVLVYYRSIHYQRGTRMQELHNNYSPLSRHQIPTHLPLM